MKDHKYIKDSLLNILGDIEVEYYKTIGSTNDYLLNKEFTHKYHLCYADIQTKGKGQRGGRWIASNSGNIYVTIGFRCNFDISKSPINSIKAAIGVLEGVKNHIPFDLQKYLKIKLPNDIYFKDQKLVGILIETKNIKWNSFEIVVGVGVNVNMFDIDENIDRQWTSLAILNAKKIEYSKVFVDVIISLIRAFEYDEESVLVKLSKYDYIANKLISFKYGNKVSQGIVKKISKDLKLTLLDDNTSFEVDLANISKIRVVK